MRSIRDLGMFRLALCLVLAISVSTVSHAFTPRVALNRQLVNRLPLELKIDADATIPSTVLNSIQEETVRLTNSTLLSRLPGGGEGKYTRILAETVCQSRFGNTQGVQVTYFMLDSKTYTADIANMNYDFVNGHSENIRLEFPTAFPPAASTGPAVPDAVLSLKATNPQVPSLARPAPDFDPARLNENLSAVRINRPPLAAVVVNPWPKALAETPVPSIQTALNATNTIISIFTARGLTSARLLGAEDTKAALLNHLRNNTSLLAWNHIGHGWPGGIVQWDASIQSADILVNPMPSRGIHWAVCLLNSCQVFNDPFRSAMRANRPRTFIGGLLNLPIGRSEMVDTRFWYRALLQNVPMGVALTLSASEMGLNGYFGIEGYTGTF